MKEEERQQYAERVMMQANQVLEHLEDTIEYKVDNVIGLSANIAKTPIEMDGEEESNDEEQEVKVVAEPLRTLLFCEKIKKLFSHCLPLKEHMKDRTISYVDPLPPRLDEYQVPRGCRRLVLWKHK